MKENIEYKTLDFSTTRKVALVLLSKSNWIVNCDLVFYGSSFTFEDNRVFRLVLLKLDS